MIIICDYIKIIWYDYLLRIMQNMANHYSKKRRLKYLLVALTCTASFALTGLAAACKDKSEDETDDKNTSVEDTQLLKNGNFEFFTEPTDEKAVYLINSPSNWSSSGSSYTKSGIINTSDKAWEKFEDETLKDTLIYNNSLKAGTDEYKENYIDYNGMKWYDIPYADTYAAIQENDKKDTDKDTDGDGETETNPYELIANPGTHYDVHKNDKGELVCTVDGEEVPVYEDEDGDYFLDEEFKQPISHILMLHNYATNHKGNKQYYSSVSVNLPANTAAEISVWVKTANLYAQDGTPVSQDRGAYIGVTHTVGSTSLGDLKIIDINTEKLIGEKKVDGVNGWVQYTVYVNACDFASTTVTLKMGLGSDYNDDYNVEGYAFFDDVQVTKFADLEESSYKQDEIKHEISENNASCQLLSDESEKVFEVDSYERNGGTADVSGDRYSNAFHFLLDLASENKYQPVNFSNSGITAGLTVDEDNYVSAKTYGGKLEGFGNAESAGDAKLPKNFPALNTQNDLLANFSGNSLSISGYEYNKILNDALESLTTLPKYSDETDVLVMLSAYGAAYKASFDIQVASEERQIVSFWVKTSDMKGYTAATVTVTDADDEDTTNVIKIDTTNIKTEIGDKEDIYSGWVQCFVFVENELKTDKTITVDINFGNTVIKDTSVNNYKAGWLAVANMQTLTVDEDTFGYTGSGDYTASLSLTKEEKKQTAEFDSVYGAQANDIKSNIANPSHYTGVNGGSSYIVNNGSLSPEYDDKNTNPKAGLINKESFENYTDKAWYSTLTTAFNANHVEAMENWNTVFGSASVQPLIIVNELRTHYVYTKGATADNYTNYYVYDEETNVFVKASGEFDENTKYYAEKDILNYGFIGETSSLSANSYTTVSVKVKVSAGAVAYIYLVDVNSDTKDVLSFTAPDYTFYYDDEGNVLDEEFDADWDRPEHKSHIVYTLRDDGLYEKDGKLYANTWNYKKVYKNEQQTYYTYDGELVSFEDVVEGETYYKDANHQTVADHILVTKDGETNLYECKDGLYYYIVESVATEQVTPFDISLARYDYTGLSKEYMVVIDGNEDGVAGNWITVNFIVSAGSESKSYRLELWSGKREETKTTGNEENGVVLFDYSYYNVSDNTIIDKYESDIIEAYQEILESNNLLTNIPSSEENISYYENLVQGYIKDGKLAEDVLDGNEVLKNYQAHYYTFSLYDSANYVPFNADVAESNQTGYDYTASSYSESLAYLNIKDGNNRIIFTDYSTIDQSFKIDTDDSSSGNDTDDKDNTSVWLLVSSILLVVALLFTILSILIRDMVKKSKRGKTTSKNNYNPNKSNRRVRKADTTDENPVDAEVVDENEAEETAGEPESEKAVEEKEPEAENAEVQPEEQSEHVEPEQTESEPEKPDEQ